MAARTSLTFGSTLESLDRHEGRSPCLRVQIKTFPSLGSRSCASWIHRSKKPFGSTAIAPREVGRPMLELSMQGGPLHKKYKIYLDHVGVAHVPEDYEERLTEIFPKVFKHLRLFALDPYDLALSKLERNVQRDRDDVMHLART